MSLEPTWVILLVGSLVAASCALVGSFLVLRKMALLGDAISHSVLPGIAIAFLLTHSRSSIPMVIGAGALGVLTVFLVERLHRTGRLYEDASIGVVFPALFAVGVIIISRHAASVDLDLDCVLYGEIAYAPWDVLVVGGHPLGSRALWFAGGVFFLDLALIAMFYKELEITSFDPGLAAALGIPPTAMHYLLMSAVSITVVGSFDSVGAILVVAMLVVPASAALLLTRRLGAMLGIAVGVGVLSVFSGYGMARAMDFSIAGGMATAAGALFLVAWLVSPHDGVVARLVTRRRMASRLAARLLLLHLDAGGTDRPFEAVRGRLGWSHERMRTVLAPMVENGLVESSGTELRLTAAGSTLVDGTMADLAGHDR